ncbi:GAF domain-containing protein [Ktedonobacteria bacterium brp13]|nr:GAF domain-containing protein [Ktedonobacteria bacterium brp13]
MQRSLGWRDLLGNIVNAAQDKQRIASELGVSPITLSRWISGESMPRAQNLRYLLHVLPEYRSHFLALWYEEFDAAFIEEIEADTIPNEVSSAFYAQILRDHCRLPRILHRRSLCERIVQQGLKQIDPNGAGLYIAVFRCTPPRIDGKVRSLYEDTWAMSFPSEKSEEMPIRPFFGRESLIGRAVYMGQPHVIQRKDEGFRQFSEQDWWDIMESGMACPIHLDDQYAGCMVVYSLLPDYFLLPSRQELIRQFANLLALAFEPADYHPHNVIDLAHLPSFSRQIATVLSYRQRLAMMMSKQSVNFAQAECLVMQQLEAELLRDQAM